MAVSLWVVGCTTTGGMASLQPPAASYRSYDAPLDAMFRVALDACQTLDLSVEAKDEEQKRIVAAAGISTFSWGERIGIYLRSVSASQTEVSVVSKAKLKTNITAIRWEGTVHAALGERLAQLRAAGAL